MPKKSRTWEPIDDKYGAIWRPGKVFDGGGGGPTPPEREYLGKIIVTPQEFFGGMWIDSEPVVEGVSEITQALVLTQPPEIVVDYRNQLQINGGLFAIQWPNDPNIYDPIIAPVYTLEDEILSASGIVSTGEDLSWDWKAPYEILLYTPIIPAHRDSDTWIITTRDLTSGIIDPDYTRVRDIGYPAANPWKNADAIIFNPNGKYHCLFTMQISQYLDTFILNGSAAVYLATDTEATVAAKINNSIVYTDTVVPGTNNISYYHQAFNSSDPYWDVYEELLETEVWTIELELNPL